MVLLDVSSVPYDNAAKALLELCHQRVRGTVLHQTAFIAVVNVICNILHHGRGGGGGGGVGTPTAPQ